MRGSFPVCALTLPIIAAQIAAVGHAAPNPPQDNSSHGTSSSEHSQVTWDQGFQLPPGARLRFAKLNETNGPDGHVEHYRIFADAADRGIPYVLGVWRVGTDVDALQVLTETAYVNHKGLLLTNPPNPGQQDADSLDDGSEIEVGVKAAKGEPVRFILHSEDWKTMIGGTLIPFPIEAADKGCKISALLAQPDGSSVLLYVDGFPPNSVLTAQSASQGAPQPRKIYTDAKGHGSLFDSPQTKGADSGTLTETVHTTGCTVAVSIPWSKGAYHPM
jgi:hypothetical protein